MNRILAGSIAAVLSGAAGAQVLGLGVGVGMGAGGSVSISVPLPQALREAARARNGGTGALQQPAASAKAPTAPANPPVDLLPAPTGALTLQQDGPATNGQVAGATDPQPDAQAAR